MVQYFECFKWLFVIHLQSIGTSFAYTLLKLIFPHIIQIEDNLEPTQLNGKGALRLLALSCHFIWSASAIGRTMFSFWVLSIYVHWECEWGRELWQQNQIFLKPNSRLYFYYTYYSHFIIILAIIQLLYNKISQQFIYKLIALSLSLSLHSIIYSLALNNTVFDLHFKMRTEFIIKFVFC